MCTPPRTSSPKPRLILIVSEDLNPVSVIAKLKNSAFMRYFTIPCFSASFSSWIFGIYKRLFYLIDVLLLSFISK